MLCVGTAALVALPTSRAESAAPPAEVGAFRTVTDDTLAYTFEYPTTTGSGTPLNLFMSRKPERYSAAAPLTGDSRQRIVVELIDLPKGVTVSVAVGPPNPALRERPRSEWTPSYIANAVLADKSTARVTSGQRVSLAKVVDISTASERGQEFIRFEHLSQGSPTMQMGPGKETYRHALSSTTIREGTEDGTPYFYTFNVACAEGTFQESEALLRRAVESFRLVEPGPKFVTPESQPWRFF